MGDILNRMRKSLLAVRVCLSGGGRVPDSGRHDHEVSDLTVISMSCGHMDYSCSYSFALTLNEGKWFFDAECFTHQFKTETAFSGREVKSADIERLYDILERNGSIAYAETYRKPEKQPFEVMDGTMYGFCLAFSDGSRYIADSAGTARRELEDFFYRLAEKTD